MKRQERTTGNLINLPLPHSIEAEKAVIGTLLLESTAIHEVATILTPDCFYDPKLGIIYGAITAVSEKGVAVEMISVTKELIRSGSLEDVGGAYAISQLTSRIASSVNITEHARYIHQLYLARKLALVGQMITGEALNPSNDIEDVITDSIKQVETIAEATCYNALSTDIGQAARKAITLYSEREKLARMGGKVGIPTGLSKLDRILGGWHNGQLIIDAARPAMGKTAFMLMFARAAALADIPVLIFSLEMSAEDLTDRLMLSESGLDPERYKNGFLSNDEKPALCSAADNLSVLPITIDDTANLSIQQIKARAKNLQRKGKCGLILIDYLQLIDMQNHNKNYGREQEVSQCSRAAKLMAKELKVPVVLLSQLSRKNEERADKTPILSDLRESGAIEQDADVVLFLHRPEYYNEKNAESGVGKLIVAKHRNGATGVMRFRYNESLTRIYDYDTSTEQQTPF
ncbi:replicative DNA helicase [Parabacteroides pacaensis]|uniref:replicative DNA helicase n=1 Tax=Parabacteroides pacaensis TaxID=2086575 RepID=UPI000D106345|nr:replicative DNA helicase [Parabacteroides pacaensis]